MSAARAILPILLADPADVRAAIDSDDPGVNSYLDTLDGFQGRISEAMSEMRTITGRIRDRSGLSDLDTAIDRKLVRFNDRVEFDGDNMLDQFVHELKKYLMDPNRFLLLDATVASLAESMINEGLVAPPQRTMSNAGEAAIGTGFIAHSLRRTSTRCWTCEPTFKTRWPDTAARWPNSAASCKLVRLTRTSAQRSTQCGDPMWIPRSQTCDKPWPITGWSGTSCDPLVETSAASLSGVGRLLLSRCSQPTPSIWVQLLPPA